MEEIWKDIAYYEGLYQVSNFGNVRRKNKNGYFYLKPSNRKYQDVDLSKNCEHHRQAIHRLVALHFIPNPKNSSEVNHIDGNKHNNNVSNLEWVTQKENCEHAKKVLHKYPFGKSPKPVAKIDPLTNEIIETFESVSRAGRECSDSYCSRVAITNCCKGRAETAYGYKWIYLEKEN